MEMNPVGIGFAGRHHPLASGVAASRRLAAPAAVRNDGRGPRTRFETPHIKYGAFCDKCAACGSPFADRLDFNGGDERFFGVEFGVTFGENVNGGEFVFLKQVGKTTQPPA